MKEKEDFIHIMNILDCDKDSGLYKPLTDLGMSQKSHLEVLDDDFIKSLCYTDDEMTTKHFPHHEKGLLKRFLGYIHYKEDIKETITDQWQSVTRENLGRYRSSHHFSCYINKTLPPSLSTFHSSHKTLNLLLPKG